MTLEQALELLRKINDENEGVFCLAPNNYPQKEEWKPYWDVIDSLEPRYTPISTGVSPEEAITNAALKLGISHEP